MTKSATNAKKAGRYTVPPLAERLDMAVAPPTEMAQAMRAVIEHGSPPAPGQDAPVVLVKTGLLMDPTLHYRLRSAALQQRTSFRKLVHRVMGEYIARLDAEQGNKTNP